MKRHYRPVITVPITFYLKSSSELISVTNGFKRYRVVVGPHYVYYLQRGKYLWQEVQ